jgi:hypothetical protein
MTWPNTWWIVALMKYTQSFWDRSVVMLPRESMRRVACAYAIYLTDDSTVAFCGMRPDVFPAWAEFIYSCYTSYSLGDIFPSQRYYDTPLPTCSRAALLYYAISDTVFEFLTANDTFGDFVLSGTPFEIAIPRTEACVWAIAFECLLAVLTMKDNFLGHLRNRTFLNAWAAVAYDDSRLSLL